MLCPNIHDLATGSPLPIYYPKYILIILNLIVFSQNKINTNIESYYRFIDDTFVVYSKNIRQFNIVKSYLNNLNIKFTLEVEENNRINWIQLLLK